MISGEKLRQYIDRLETLESEKADLSEQIKEVLLETKSEGFDVKTVRAVLRIRKMKPDQRQEQEELLDLYLNALSSPEKRLA